MFDGALQTLIWLAVIAGIVLAAVSFALGAWVF
jgi:hypothetical protein